jgi:O-antigen/teichoic acid export membrane protein
MIMGLVAGVGTARGATLLIVSPAVAASAFAATRQLYNAMFKIRLLVIVDLTVNLIQIAVTVALALLHAPPPALAAVFTLSLTTNSLVIAFAAFRSTPARRPFLAERWAIVRKAVPVGVASVLSSVYFTIDMVILPWLVGGPSVGRYGAACKVLSVLVTIPGLVVGAALPGFSLAGADRAQFSELMARVEQWLATVALPLCGFIVVFAGPITTVLFGPEYHDAAPLLRILAGAAAAASLGNVFGTALVSKSLVRTQVVCNALAMVLNIGANIALAPRFGVTAAAWVTLATELFVVAWACVVLRHAVDLRRIAARLGRPALATAALMLLGLGFQSTLPVAVPLAVLGFVAVLTVLHGWPEEFRIWRLRPQASAGARG